MNWKKLPKDKRNKLIAVAAATLVVLGVLGFGLIRYQYGRLADLDRRKADADVKLASMHRLIEHANEVEAELAAAAKNLGRQEEGMASGDLYSWALNSIRRFKLPYSVDIPSISPAAPAETGLFPKFAYGQTTVTLGGTAFYHDFGRFLADLENEFPYARVLNLNLELSPGASPTDREKLAFRMELITLVKPNQP